jgi:ABC-2 type transport system permease protein
MRPATAVLRNEARLLRQDPVPFAVLIAMPLILMVLLSPALETTLAAEGFEGAPGAAQTAPGMACVFASFGIAIVGFTIFREHGWRTWIRLRAAGLPMAAVVAGKLAMPAALLGAQAVVLFGGAVLLLDLRASGSWPAVALTCAALAAVVLTAGLAATALVATVQQLNAITNVGAMIAGGLGGGFVPVDSLPEWIQPLAPLSPVYWAMQGYREALLEGGGVTDVAAELAVLLAFAGVCAVVALRRLRLDEPKRTWG